MWHLPTHSSSGVLDTPSFGRLLTIVISLLLVVPTAYWVHWRMQKMRPWVEFVTLMPFVVPAVVLVFGMSRLYGGGLKLFGTPILVLTAYADSLDSWLRGVVPALHVSGGGYRIASH